MVKNILVLAMLLGAVWSGFAQSKVTVAPKIQKYLGDVSEMDRTKFFNLHSGSGDADLQKFFQDYNVGYGRGFWGAFSFAKGKTGAAGVYPDFRPEVDPGVIRTVKKGYVATEHPSSTFINGIDAVKAGEWAAEYYKNWVSNGDVPEYFEPMNEPFVHADDFTSGDQTVIKEQMSEVFNQVGKAIHATPELVNMKIIGYSSAWPEMERNDFAHWYDNQQLFMDIAGANMDGFATHLYDGINVTGQDTKRSGSNSEAVLDMIETYSMYKFGEVKPHAITEYGGIAAGYPDGWNDTESSQSVKSNNQLIFNLMNRENDLLYSIPFITDKSTWHMNADNNYEPYGAVILRPADDQMGKPHTQVTEWVYTPKIYFYELWKAVEGERVYVSSTNPDIQVNAFAMGKKLYVAMVNLDDQSQSVDLDFDGGYEGLLDVKIKTLKIYQDKVPDFNENTVSSAPANMTLIADEAVVLEYTYSSEIAFDNASRSNKYYAAEYLKAITGGPITFNFNGVDAGMNGGQAYLRMSIGRKHNRSKRPIVKVNGTQVSVPTNWSGYDQASRQDFFGMIEIPLDVELLEENNVVTIQFSDTGGHISSLVLQVDLFDKQTDVSIGKGAEYGVEIYPTHVRDGRLNIRLKEANQFDRLELYNLAGRKVRSQIIEANRSELVLTDMQEAKGIYIIRLSGKNALFTQKIVIQ